jgi:hypothetical protein
VPQAIKLPNDDVHLSVSRGIRIPALACRDVICSSEQ